MKSEKLYYKYRAFNSITLELLCHDTIYYANPSSFNDPLDCNPTIACNSNIDELRLLYSFLFRKRKASEILQNLKNAKVNDKEARKFAISRADFESKQELAEVAYYATDPEYSISEEQVEINILHYRIEQEINKHYTQGVSCFSSSYSSPLLWSHYGDQHKGICIGYSTNRKPIPNMQSVIYGGNRSVNTSILVDAFLHNDKKAQHELDQNVLLRKAKGWSYERESRLIGQQGIQDSPLLLTEIIFGLRCPEAIKHTICKALDGRKKNVSYYQIQTKANSYSLRKCSFDNGEYSYYFPKTAESGIEIFGPFIEDSRKNA